MQHLESFEDLLLLKQATLLCASALSEDIHGYDTYSIKEFLESTVEQAKDQMASAVAGYVCYSIVFIYKHVMIISTC